jgi:hypothetical protein
LYTFLLLCSLGSLRMALAIQSEVRVEWVIILRVAITTKQTGKKR